jgi:hypothetical protein
MRKFSIALSSLATIAFAGVAGAQGPSLGAVAGYAALVSTPVGAMSPLITNAMLGRTGGSYDIAGRYGHLSGDQGAGGFNSFGASASMPYSGFTLGATLGYLSPSCPSGSSCDGNMMLGLNAETRLTSAPMGEGKDASMMNIGVRGDFGWANPTDATALALSAQAPITLVAKTGGMTIAPFLSPGFGWGRLSASASGVTVSESGARFMFGGGIGLLDQTAGWGVSLGMQKVFIDQGKTVFGLNFTYGK